MNATSPASTIALLVLVTLVALAMGWLFHRSGVERRWVWIGCTLWILYGVLVSQVGQRFGAEAMLLVILPVPLVGLGIAFTPLGLRLGMAAPLAVLAGLQVFRFPLELILDAWHRAGHLPVQITFRGDNLDILSGILAIPAAVMIAKGVWPKLTAWVFNVVGLALLLRVIWIVLLSSPTPARTAFGGYTQGPDILLAMTVPHVWIVTIAVFSALVWHGVSLRVLIRQTNS